MFAAHHTASTPGTHTPGHPTGQPAGREAALGEADLRRLEDALLDALLDVRPNRANALDRLLTEWDATDGTNDDTASAADRGHGVARRRQVEELLLAALLDTQSDRNRALDRILAGIPEPSRTPLA